MSRRGKFLDGFGECTEDYVPWPRTTAKTGWRRLESLTVRWERCRRWARRREWGKQLYSASPILQSARESYVEFWISTSMYFKFWMLCLIIGSFYRRKIMLATWIIYVIVFWIWREGRMLRRRKESRRRNRLPSERSAHFATRSEREEMIEDWWASVGLKSCRNSLQQGKANDRASHDDIASKQREAESSFHGQTEVSDFTFRSSCYCLEERFSFLYS